MRIGVGHGVRSPVLEGLLKLSLVTCPIQLFNATNHFNPRDVYAVVGAPQWGRFANSVGPILRGFMMLKWR